MVALTIVLTGYWSLKCLFLKKNSIVQMAHSPVDAGPLTLQTNMFITPNFQRSGISIYLLVSF